MRKSLKTTTALVASFHLAFPQVAIGQTAAELTDQILQACDGISAEDCAATLGVDVAAVQAVIEAQSGAVAAEGAEQAAAAEAEASGQAAAAEAEGAAAAEAEAAEQAKAEAAAQAEAEAAAQAEAEANAAAEAEAAEQDAAAEAEAAEQAAAAEAEAAEQAAAAEANAAAEAEAVEQAAAAEAEDAAEQAAAEAEQAAAAEAAVAEQAAAAEAEMAAEQAAEAEANASTEAEATEETADAEAEAADAAEAPPTDQADTTQTAETADVQAESDTATAETEAATVAEGLADAQADSSVDSAEAAPETQMTDSERAALEGGATPSVAAGDEDAAPAEEIASQTVTEDSARSSTEDFESAIAREAAPAETTQAAPQDDDDGLSNLQKALIAGAGILAVGTLLNNNRQVVASSQDRVVVEGQDGGYELIKDDTALLQRPGTEVSTERFDDGSTRTTVTREDGTRIVTIRDADLRVLRRTRIDTDGTRTLLLDDTAETQAVDVSRLRQPAAETRDLSEDALRSALSAEVAFDRGYSLAQIRNIAEVRNQVPAISLDNITFESGSAAIQPEQADELTALGRFIRERIAENPREIFMVEGHTDAVGNGAYNLALSDRRAESVALALTEYFDVPPENLVVQGYGERFLKVPTLEAERANRRATLRRITPLLQVARAE